MQPSIITDGARVVKRFTIFWKKVKPLFAAK